MESQPLSPRKPAGFPDVEIIKNTPKKPKSPKSRSTNLSRLPRNMGNVPDFTPGYVTSSSNLRNARINKCPSQQEKSEQNGENVRWNKSETALKPTHEKPKVFDPEVEKTENLYRHGIDNKLTPSQKLQPLVDQINSLPIKTEKRLQEVVDLVYEKALDDTNFIEAYANLCKRLAMIKVPKSNAEGSVIFRQLLLSKCQEEFEKDITDEVDRAMKLKEIPEGAEKKREMEEEFEELESRVKRRSVRNIRFIGELFKVKMLTAGVMHDCLKKFASQEDEHSLECLCQLLTTIGKDMVTYKGKSSKKPEVTDDRMNCYFRQMQEMVEKRQISSRVRSMVQDVMELRLNNWDPCREENNTKTSDQIYLEAEKDSGVAPEEFPSLAAPYENSCQEVLSSKLKNKKTKRKTKNC